MSQPKTNFDTLAHLSPTDRLYARRKLQQGEALADAILAVAHALRNVLHSIERSFAGAFR